VASPLPRRHDSWQSARPATKTPQAGAAMATALRLPMSFAALLLMVHYL